MSNAISRRTLLQGAALLAAARQIACAAEPGRAQGTQETRSSREPQLSTDEVDDYDAFACAAVPTAYVVPGASAAAFATLAAALEAAGFAVEQLALDRAPLQLRGLIVIPSGAAASADYASYMARYASELYGFVDSAARSAYERVEPAAQLRGLGFHAWRIEDALRLAGVAP